MDSHIPSDKRYVLLDKDIADMINDINTDELRQLLEMLTRVDCECGCRGRSHVTIIAQDGRQFPLSARPHRDSTTPDFQAQFRV